MKLKIKNIEIIGDVEVDNYDFDKANIKVIFNDGKEIETYIDYYDFDFLSDTACGLEYILDGEETQEEIKMKIEAYINFYVFGEDNECYSKRLFESSNFFARCLETYFEKVKEAA